MKQPSTRRRRKDKFITVKIYYTEDLSKFKKHPLNRINLGNLNDLQFSIEKKDNLQKFPIIVGKNFFVYDGQRRLEACRKSGEIKGVWYRIIPDLEPEDMVCLNYASKSWDLADVIRFFSKSGNKNYKKLIKFINYYSFSRTEAVLKIFKAHATRKMLKTGTFIYPKNDYFERGMAVHINEFSDIFPEFWDSRYLAEAISHVYRQAHYDTNKMIKFCKKSIPTGDIYFRSETNQLTKILTDVFNMHSKNGQLFLPKSVKNNLDKKRAQAKKILDEAK